MEKLGQKRTVWNKLREKTNITGIAAEKFFNKEFETAMNALRANDDEIRKIMLGQSVENLSMKDLMATTKSSLNKREYLNAFMDLGKIHNQLMAIANAITSIKRDMTAVHEDMLLKNFKDNDKLSIKEKEEVSQRRQYLSELQKRLAHHQKNQLIKQAGLMDFFKNIGTEEGRALIAWEKRYPREVAKWREGTSSILESAKSIYVELINQLKIMAKARSVRNLDSYIDAATPLLSLISNFDKNFKKYYQEAIQPLVKKLELDNPGVPSQTVPENDVATKSLQEQEVSSARPILNQTLENSPDTIRNPNLKPGYITEPLVETLMNRNRLPLPSEVSDEESGPVGLVNPSPMKAAHTQFYRVLEKFSNESPLILKSIISKYAKTIINSDLETSVKLNKIASLIKVEK